MPKLKKRRTKRYDPTRYAEMPPQMSLQTAEEIKGMFRDVQLAVELRLHRGQFEEPDVLNLGSTILLATFCLYRGYGVDGEHLVIEYGTEWVAMQEAFKSFSKRAEKTGCFTCTAHELDAIRNGLEIVGDVINACLDVDPVRVSELFLVTEDLSDFPQDARERMRWLDHRLEQTRRRLTKTRLAAKELYEKQALGAA